MRRPPRERTERLVTIAQGHLIEALLILDPTDKDHADYRRIIKAALVKLERAFPLPRRRHPR